MRSIEPVHLDRRSRRGLAVLFREDTALLPVTIS